MMVKCSKPWKIFSEVKLGDFSKKTNTVEKCTVKKRIKVLEKRNRQKEKNERTEYE